MLTDLLEITYITVKAAAATAAARAGSREKETADSLKVTKDYCNLLVVCQLSVSFTYT
jgi:hypothetical protein